MMSLTDETADNIRKSELFQCYRRGWKHGACSNAQDPKFVEHARADIGQAYLRGYSDGRDHWLIMSARECERLQYNPMFSILRAGAPAQAPSKETR